MQQKCGIYAFLLVAVVADWVQIPVLNPHNLESSDFTEESSFFKSSPNTLTATSKPPSSIHNVQSNYPSEVISKKNEQVLADELQNNISFHKDVNDSSHRNQLHKEIILYPNKEIDPNFLVSVMNNSQKADRIVLEFPQSESKENAFLELLKNVHLSLFKGSLMTINGKMKFLQDLQTKLYSYIKPRIKRLWIIEERQARTEKGMGFPSMDGALMTISFLLFAVFLIKLVKQLIQQLQEKANANALMMTGATPVVPGAGTNLNFGRRKRQSSEERDVAAAARILHLIESFKVKYNKLAAPH